MSTYNYNVEAAGYEPWQKTLDATGFMGERFLNHIFYTSFSIDGTMFVVDISGGQIVRLAQFAGDAELFSADSNLAAGPFLALINGPNVSKAKILDYLTGGDDVLNGSQAGEKMQAGAGADHLYGNGGADKLDGGKGDDVLDGGAGKDKLTGGAGADTFVFTGLFGKDTVTDFVAGVDHLQFDHALFATADDVLAHAHQVNNTVVIAVDVDHTVVLSHQVLANLHASDFLLV